MFSQDDVTRLDRLLVVWGIIWRTNQTSALLCASAPAVGVVPDAVAVVDVI
ncbi:MAG TPA: hypothetical protein VFC01_25200 [Mycobacterium sp.]|nr:hypothetical protein [Mycobacterium sp.]